MDYVEGGNLAALVHEKPLPAKRAAAYVKTVAEAIHYAHEQGILHRDLKPSNVIIDQRDEPRVTDFGLAKQIHADSGLTATGEILGSPSFTPPEQAAGRVREIGPRSDVYGLGAMLYYLLTGRPPFAGSTIHETLALVQHSEPMPLRALNPEVPRDLETICLKCLEKSPDRRFATAEEVADDVRRFLNSEPIHARPPDLPRKLLRFSRGEWVRGVTGCLLMAVGLLVCLRLGLSLFDRNYTHSISDTLIVLNIFLFGMLPGLGGALLWTTASAKSTQCKNCGNTEHRPGADWRGVPNTAILAFGIPIVRDITILSVLVRLLTKQRPYVCLRCGFTTYSRSKGTRVVLTYLTLCVLITAVTSLPGIDSSQRRAPGDLRGRRVERSIGSDGAFQNARNSSDPGPGSPKPDPRPNSVSGSIPARDSATRRKLVDLSRHHNAAFRDSWLHNWQSNDLASLPTGVQKLRGTDFYVRGLIQLSSAGYPRLVDRYPHEVRGIQIGQRFSKAHFLHAGAGGDSNGAIVGRYTFHYVNGSTQDVPLIYADDLRDWWLRPDKSKKVNRAVVAWTGTNAASAAKGASLRLFKLTWANPQPDMQVRSLDFVSGASKCAPFLVSITLEP
jgi:hypothetical protein